MRGENPSFKLTDKREADTLRRLKRRFVSAFVDARDRGRRPTKAKPLELRISTSDYMLLRSHGLVDDDGLYENGLIKLRIA